MNRRCPRCLTYPGWKYQHWTSAKTHVGTWTFMFGCSHCLRFATKATMIQTPSLPAVEAAWDDFAAKLFDAYTAPWTAIERDRFREHWINHAPEPPITLPGQLTLDRIAATKLFCDSAKASTIDPDEEPAF